MAAASSSSSSSPSSSSSSPCTVDGFTYDVFINFRGEDTRLEFTRNLSKALVERGILTFFDEKDIRKGDKITPSLLQSIEQSRMSLVVLSPNYATSSFCLDELFHILHCIRGRGRFVWPIFYDVDPSDVRWLKNNYGKAMIEHETMSRYNTDRLENWKTALHQVANLSGTHFKKGDKSSYELIEEIVKEVSRQIKPFTIYVADYLVGLGPQEENVISLLNLGLDDKVHMVGIHGIGGIGKTTLSLSVYNSIADQFYGSCFLENIRENSEKHGLTYLQKIILSEIVGEKEIQLTSVREGITIIQRRLQQKKVLLLLDDVDKGEQLRALVGKPQWFGPGSRVIITTRDTRLLTCHEIESTYEVKGLSKIDATKLLRWNAFHTEEVSPDYEDVLNRALTYASGLPLALTVIGSHLYKKTIDQCKCTLDRYERTPNKEIQAILKVSFDALEEEEKSVFLDIACFFKRHNLTKVERILHAHYDESKKHHISVLIEKSLIKISKSGDLTLHDLIEDMGKEIVRQESSEEPGRRSRLWSPKDIVQVLKDNAGTNKNEIIYLHSWISIQCEGQAFKKMENLKTLIIINVRFSEFPIHLPNSLRVLQWDCSPWGLYSPSFSQVLLFDSHPKKLVMCEIDGEHVASIICTNLFNKSYEYMRVLDIKQCSLTHIGDVSGLSNLEEISLSQWTELTTIHDSMGLLDKLKILCVRDCQKLTSFPPLMLPSLKELILEKCGQLESVLSMDGWLGKLKIFIIMDCCMLKSIPAVMLPLLEVLELTYCWSLESIPPMYGFFGKLKILRIEYCLPFISIPPLKLPLLEELNLWSFNSLKNIPLLGDESLWDFKKYLNLNTLHFKLPSLMTLIISACDALESISFINESINLKNLEIHRCNKLVSIPPLKLPSLVKLRLSNCDSLESISHLNLPSLQVLDISYCYSLESIAPLDASMGKLIFLRVEGCKKLTSIPPLDSPLLEQLELSYCTRLESFPILSGVMENITELSMFGTPIKELPFSIQNLTRLQTLNLKNCGVVKLPSSITMMSELTKLIMVCGGWIFPQQDEGEEKESPIHSSRVELLWIQDCNLSDESFAICFKWFVSVKELDLTSSKFVTLPECIKKCHCLWKLVMDDCEELQEIKGIPPNLKILSIYKCKKLQEINGIVPQSLKTLSAFKCKSLTMLCKSKLLNQELHEDGNTNFLLPGEEIPEWFNHQCSTGLSVSFWFRNEFPTIALCVVSTTSYYSEHSLKVTINGNTFFYQDNGNKQKRSAVYHLHLFHMQMENFNDNPYKAISQSEWNHAEIDFGFEFMASGIHVLRKEDEEDVRFTSPNIES